MARGYFRYNAPLQAILLFSDILCSGIVPDDHTFPSLLKACASSEVLQEGYARSSRPNEALSLFRELQVSDLKPTDVTLLSILSSCALLGALDLGRWRHEYVKIHGFDKYVKFANMSVRDTQAWSAIVMACATHGHGSNAISLFEEMKRVRVRPDEITFLSLLKACSHTGLVREGCEHFYSMSNKYGIIPGIKHYGCMVDLLSRAGHLDEAYKFIDGLPI
ncbi:pentatricopeptide repeat-containing protein [Quercus suber]|uniref:Pentatricopeptide repeat-containing protein n=1 Tax=Quercus suber TaxID=58331 RepID=A0AAW0JGB1_QUESU